jgi:hypothetical protein
MVTTTTTTTPTSYPRKGVVHLVILIHGLQGNDMELAYFQESLERQALQQQKSHKQPQQIVVHSAKCNLGRTSDGITKGGDRLVQEVEEQLDLVRCGNNGNDNDLPVYLSFVGNSLGGLYARYAIAHLRRTESIVPYIFCTIATPHLGVSNNTYVAIPRWAEVMVATAFGTTGHELFHRTPLLHEMGTDVKYLSPLGRFRKRIAVANAFWTDFQVPSPTAAFLSKTSNYVHQRLPDKKDYLLSVQTEVTEVYDRGDASQCLDALGWTKVFLDVRKEIPLPAIPILFAEEPIVPNDRELWTSHELRETMNKSGRTWKLPLGHMVSCANSRDRFNRWLNARGQPFMDQLALDLLEVMSEAASSNPQECVIAE